MIAPPAPNTFIIKIMEVQKHISFCQSVLKLFTKQANNNAMMDLE